MSIQLVEITKDDNAQFKGSWYRTGELHFVTVNPDYPTIYASKYSALHLRGGIHEDDCKLIKGPLAMLACAIASVVYLFKKRWD